MSHHFFLLLVLLLLFLLKLKPPRQLALQGHHTGYFIFISFWVCLFLFHCQGMKNNVKSVSVQNLPVLLKYVNPLIAAELPALLNWKLFYNLQYLPVCLILKKTYSIFLNPNTKTPWWNIWLSFASLPLSNMGLWIWLLCFLICQGHWLRSASIMVLDKEFYYLIIEGFIQSKFSTNALF